MKNIEPITMYYLRKSLIFLILLLLIEFSSGRERDTLSTGQKLKDGDSLVSIKKTFTLGFYSPGKSPYRYLAIWYYNLRGNKVVWVANRDKPVNDSSGVMSIDTPNHLVIYGSKLRVPIWSTSFLGSGMNYSAQLLDTGNLVVFEENQKEVIAWQSFDHPTDTWLPQMKIGVNRKTGLHLSLRSWRSDEDPGTGQYLFRMDIIRELTELSLYRGSHREWRSGPFNGASFFGEISPMYILNVTYVHNEEGVYITYSMPEPLSFSVIMLTYYGQITMDERKPQMLNWTVAWAFPQQCDTYNHCGPNKYCADPNENVSSQCSCFPGYTEEKLGGCVRKRGRNVCRSGEGFVKMSSMKMPDTTTARVDTMRGLRECEEKCLKDCNCTAYANAYEKGIACVMWSGNLLDTRNYASYESSGQDLFVRVELEQIRGKRHRSSNKKRKAAIVATCVGVVGALIAVFILCWHRHKRTQELRSRAEQGPANILSKELFDANERNANIQFFDLISLVEATNNFCDENKLGKGGFGTVYKGTLKDGYVIAVKRLSDSSQQGVVEFKNEATLISRLQHMNLVRLLGCCAEQEEKILIYEYMPNNSLDSLIFDPEKSSCLDWEQRFNIIMGITRGMMYLHNDSRLKIIHRDLKASNILLDARMNPKVSDFGMARFFDTGEVEAVTRTVVGTRGYISPEYTATGTYSTKSDVYSFGVLLLEIISGKKNSTYINEKTATLIDLASYLGEHALEIVDSSMGDYPAKKVQRCIYVGLLCVQQNPDYRPTMSEIFVMLSSEKTDLPTLHPPGIVHCPLTIGQSSSSDYTSFNVYTSSSSDYTPSSSSGACKDLTYSESIPR